MVDTKCDKCGDESNSEPDLQCGRLLGVDADDEESLPPRCDGTYRSQDLWVMANGLLYAPLGTLADACRIPEIADLVVELIEKDLGERPSPEFLCRILTATAAQTAARFGVEIGVEFMAHARSIERPMGRRLRHQAR